MESGPDKTPRGRKSFLKIGSTSTMCREDPGSRTGHGEGADWVASKGQALCLQDHLYLVTPVESGQLW